MATINNKLIHFKSKSDFNSRYRETTDGGNTYGDFLGTSIVFIQDAKQIWTHGQFYDANEATLASLGITATAEELNYMDGVTSNVQTQLNGKAATSHNHNASNINAGTLDIARIPTGTSASTVALGNHTHSEYAASSHTHGTDDVTALTGYTEGTSTTILAPTMSLNAALASLQNQIQDKASKSGDYLEGDYSIEGDLTITNLPESVVVSYNSITAKSAENLSSLTIDTNDLTLTGGQKSVLLDQNGFTYDGSQILTEANWNEYITVTDTKNTTGTFQSLAKLYLVGAASQSSTGVVTYSNSNVYTQSGQLYATRMNATSGFYETSDGTLKNIKSELNIADNIDKIPTVLFSWKKDESEDINQDVPVHVGTIAQDIQKIYPDLVAEDAEGHLTVDYAKLSVIAIAAIKELKKEIEILKSKIN